MTENTREFLHSLHPLMPEELIAVQSDQLRLQKLPCFHLLVDINNDKRMIKLNETGILIWGLCQDQRTVGEIVDLLSEAFEVERDQMAQDVSRIVEHLLAEEALINSNNVVVPE